MKKSLLIFCIVLLSNSAFATDYSVTSGQSIQSVFDTYDLGADDRIIVGTGTYTGNIVWGANDEGTSGHPVVLMPATGASPIIVGSITIGGIEYAKIESGFVIQSTGAHAISITSGAQESHHIEVYGVTTAGTCTSHEVYLYSGASQLHDILIDSFELGERTVSGDIDGIRIVSYASAPYNITISNGTINAGYRRGINTFQTATDETKYPPYGVTITGNTITNPEGPWIATNAGLAGTLANTISGNTCTYAGEPDRDNINGIQLSWVDNTVVERNTLDGVATSLCDGKIIIVDHAYQSTSYPSSDVTIRYNDISGGSADCSSGNPAAIAVWDATDTTIYGNMIHDSTNGIILTQSYSTGTQAFNNSYQRISLRDIYIKDSAPASEFFNEALNGGGNYGIYVEDGSTIPTVHHNASGGHSTAERWEMITNATFAAGTGSIDENPLLNATTGRPGNDNLISAGYPVSLTGENPINDENLSWDNNQPDIGAVQSNHKKGHMFRSAVLRNLYARAPHVATYPAMWDTVGPEIAEPSGGDALLLETGDYFLLEDGSKLLLE